MKSVEEATENIDDAMEVSICSTIPDAKELAPRTLVDVSDAKVLVSFFLNLPVTSHSVSLIKLPVTRHNVRPMNLPVTSHSVSPTK